MGYNTACIILNDQLHELAKQEDAGRDIELAILTVGRKGARDGGALEHRARAFDCLPSQHADTVQIVAVGGNRIQLLGHGHWRHSPEALLKQLAEQMGFRVVRRPAPKGAPGGSAEGVATVVEGESSRDEPNA